MINNPPERLHQLFTQHHLRCTRQRRAIYQVLTATDTHPTADQLYQRVRQHLPSISLATVYNTLEAFCDVGLAQKLPGHGSENGSARYDGTVHDHPHLRCEETGRILDLPEPISHTLLERLPRRLLDEIGARLGFDIHRVHIELVGQRRDDVAHHAQSVNHD